MTDLSYIHSSKNGTNESIYISMLNHLANTTVIACQEQVEVLPLHNVAIYNSSIIQTPSSLESLLVFFPTS